MFDSNIVYRALIFWAGRLGMCCSFGYHTSCFKYKKGKVIFS